MKKNAKAISVTIAQENARLGQTSRRDAAGRGRARFQLLVTALYKKKYLMVPLRLFKKRSTYVGSLSIYIHLYNRYKHQ